MATRTTFTGKIRSGRDTGIPASTDIGVAQLVQEHAFTSVPVTGQRIAVLPSSARILGISVYQTSALAGEAVIRFSNTNNGGNILGSISLSAANVYRLNAPSSAASVWFNTGASSQQIYATVLSASGQISTLANELIATVDYYRIP